jgi:hypothetical protein
MSQVIVLFKRVALVDDGSLMADLSLGVCLACEVLKRLVAKS